ncbi:hypothetical protein [Bradyrhizobium sp. 131]|uniref:hypothetical protein n=1 Tax=Bradyrhizobium sp. 131 TaxID=2782609 RepID=UPI001FFE3EBE|nr:hypothetical protein [Bradyrhizobium sp. 131]UPK16793.1 hypothetical protein IVA73_21915 [Bradyrhizobium sp. 131]
MFGDIVLIYGDEKSASRVAQRALYQDGLPIVTHAAMFIGKYTLFHSVRTGVEETVFMEVMHPNAKYRILRFAPLHDFLVRDQFANLGLFQEAFLALAGDQYNLRITRKGHQRVFCSELIGEIFLACGFRTLGSSHKLLPTKIDRIARRDPINWVDVTAEQNEKLKSLAAYKLFHDSGIHPGASAGLMKAKRHMLRERLKHNAAMGNVKEVAGAKHFGTVKPREYGEMLAGYKLEPLSPEEKKQRIRPDDIEFWFRAHVILMTADQAVFYFMDPLEKLIGSRDGEIDHFEDE